MQGFITVNFPEGDVELIADELVRAGKLKLDYHDRLKGSEARTPAELEKIQDDGAALMSAGVQVQAALARVLVAGVRARRALEAAVASPIDPTDPDNWQTCQDCGLRHAPGAQACIEANR